MQREHTYCGGLPSFTIKLTEHYISCKTAKFYKKMDIL